MSREIKLYGLFKILSQCSDKTKWIPEEATLICLKFTVKKTTVFEEKKNNFIKMPIPYMAQTATKCNQRE